MKRIREVSGVWVSVGASWMRVEWLHSPPARFLFMCYNWRERETSGAFMSRRFALIYLEGNRIFKMKPKRKHLCYCLEGRLLNAGTGTHPSIKPESSGSIYRLRHLLEDWSAAGGSQGPGYCRRRGRYRSYICITSAGTFCFRLHSSWGSFKGCQRWGWGRDKKHAQPLRTFGKILLSWSLLRTMRIKIFPRKSVVNNQWGK